MRRQRLILMYLLIYLSPDFDCKRRTYRKMESDIIYCDIGQARKKSSFKSRHFFNLMQKGQTYHIRNFVSLHIQTTVERLFAIFFFFCNIGSDIVEACDRKM